MKSFIRMTEEADRPAAVKSEITTSKGHRLWTALVTIASTLWPAEAPNSLWFERTTAGRRLCASRSAKGNGTTTTDHCSKVMVSLIVFLAGALGQG
jgi:hypothetical protein